MIINIREKETAEFEKLETLRWEIIDKCNDCWDSVEFYRGEFAHRESLKKAEQELSEAQERLEEVENKIHNFTGYRSNFNRTVYRGSIKGLNLQFLPNRNCGLLDKFWMFLMF